jgi:transposase-like protein
VVARGKSLVSRRERAHETARAADEALYQFMDNVSREYDVSVRKLARAIGVPSSTLGGWKKRGQHLSD